MRSESDTSQKINRRIMGQQILLWIYQTYPLKDVNEEDECLFIWCFYTTMKRTDDIVIGIIFEYGHFWSLVRK